ncbi:MAG TPA: ATP-binding protein [Thermodesulfobacteriota bacterium]
MTPGLDPAERLPTIDRIPWWRRWRTLVLGAFLLVIVTAMIRQYAAAERAFHDAERVAVETQGDTASALARATALFVERYQVIASQAAAVAFGLDIAPDERRRFLALLPSLHPDIEAAVVTDARGRIIAAARADEIGTDLSGRPYFQALRDGANLVVSDLLLDVAARPVTPVAAAGRDRDGRFLGALVFGLPTRHLEERLRLDLAGGAYAVVVDRKGHVVVHGLRPDLAFDARDFSTLPVVQKALRGEVAAAADILDPVAGEPSVGAMVPVPSLGWAVGVFQPAESAFASARAERRAALVEIGLILAVGLALALALGLWLSAPIAALSAGVAALARGDLGHRVPVRGPGELESLARDFNTMGEALRRANEELRASHAQMEEHLAQLAAANRSLDEALARAETERQRLEVTFDALPDAALVVDADAVVVIANERARRLLGDYYRPGFGIEAPVRPPVTPHLIDGKPMPVEDIPLRRALHHGERTLATRFSIITPAGELRHVVVSAAPVTSPDGRTLGAVTVLRDVTEAQLLETVKDQFIARASHELRTPLTAIRGTIRFLGRALTGRSAERPEELVAIAERNVEHMVRLIDDLLDASRLQSGRASLTREPIALDRFLDEVVRQFVPAARERRVALATTAPPGLTVEADRLKLEQVLTNLVGNALKFTGEGGQVTVEASPMGDDEVEIRVRDTGVGIPAEHLSRVFEPFFQAGPPTRRERGPGAGLGLTIARALVELHGGRIGVESEGPGRGSTFVVTLPRRAADATP